MKIAVEGCMHGELDNVYATLRHLERVENVKIDLLICCGDFQAVRDESDLESLNVKPKFRRMNSFWKYYTGQEIAPIPTIFIGGNHEASNYLWELQAFILEAGRPVDLQLYNFLKRKSHKNKFILRHMYYGGWAAPNIYFLGYAGVLKFGNVRIGGLSGIYNAQHYSLGHFERPPYNESDIRSVYHVREYDVHKLMQIEDPLDVFISHDWPRGIADFGNWRKLIRQKPFFGKEVLFDEIDQRSELQSGVAESLVESKNREFSDNSGMAIHERTLGSRAAALLLDKLKPPYWFSAHLHCKFAAAIKHEKDGQVTKFLALDKCLPGRQFLQIVEIGSDAGPYEFQYDEEWLAITRKLNSRFPLTRRPAELGTQPLDMQKHREWVRSKLTTRKAKPFEFAKATPFSGHHCRNPQTESFLQLLELPYLLDHTSQTGTVSQVSNPLASEGAAAEQGDNEVGSADDVDELEELASG